MKYIHDQKLTKGIQHKLLIKLLGYNFTIEYKQGKNNSVADALSRVKYKTMSLKTTTIKPAWIAEVVASYTNDTKCKELLVQLATCLDSVPNFTLQQGILRYKQRIVIADDK